MAETTLTMFIIDDDPGDITLLRRELDQISKWRMELFTFTDSEAALRELSAHKVDIILLDYLLGAETGLDILQKVQVSNRCCPIIMLTGKGSEEVAVEAMRLGAADYLVKGTVSSAGLERAILNSLEKHRLQQQVERQRRQLQQRVSELEEALAHVKQLQGLLPICAYCKRIRDDRDVWQQIEEYLSEHTDAMFSHSICQECMEKNHPDMSTKTRKTQLNSAK